MFMDCFKDFDSDMLHGNLGIEYKLSSVGCIRFGLASFEENSRSNG